MQEVTKPVDEMTDLEFVKYFINKCHEFVNPVLWRECRQRGLAWHVNDVRGTKEERLAQAVAKMAAAGHYVGEPEIEEIAGHIKRIKHFQDLITSCSPADAANLLTLIDNMRTHVKFVNDYYKKPAIPS